MLSRRWKVSDVSVLCCEGWKVNDVSVLCCQEDGRSVMSVCCVVRGPDEQTPGSGM